MPDVEIYKRPNQAPAEIVPDENIRIYYLGHWIDFREGQIRIMQDITYQPVVEIEVRRVKS